MPPVPKPKSPKQKRTKPDGGGPFANRTVLLAIGGAAVVAVILVAASLVLSGGDDNGGATTGPTSGATTLVDGIPQDGTVLGDPAATVTLLTYEDIQCPVCRRYTEAGFPTIVDEYVRAGKVKVDFRGLEFLGDDSTKALKVVLAAAKQDRAWQLIELLYANQGRENSGWVSDGLIRELAGRIDGLDVDTMLADAETPAIQEEIDRVASEAADRRVQGTPWFYVQIGDAEPYEVQPTSLEGPAFQPILDDALRG